MWTRQWIWGYIKAGNFLTRWETWTFEGTSCILQLDSVLFTSKISVRWRQMCLIEIYGVFLMFFLLWIFVSICLYSGIKFYSCLMLSDLTGCVIWQSDARSDSNSRGNPDLFKNFTRRVKENFAFKRSSSFSLKVLNSLFLESIFEFQKGLLT